MTARSLCACCILLVVRAAAADGAASGRLELAVEPPVIVVPATAPGRRFIDLPALEYRFEVQAACTGSRTPRALSINVADSRVALSGAALGERAGAELILNVPARQLAPIAVDDFCVAAREGTAAGDEAVSATFAPSRLLTVPDVVSAQASLVCGDEQGSDISYVTKPLAVTLACAAADERGAEAPGKQGGGRDVAQ